MNTNNTENNTKQRGYGSNAFHNIKSFFEDKLASEEAEKNLRQSLKEGVTEHPMAAARQFTDEKRGQVTGGSSNSLYATVTTPEFKIFLEEAEKHWEEIAKATQTEIYINPHAELNYRLAQRKLAEVTEAVKIIEEFEAPTHVTYFADDLKQQFQKL